MGGMDMMKFVLGGLALAMLSAGPAMSADAIVMPQAGSVARGAFSWTSWYVGAFAGAAWTGERNYIGTLQPFRVSVLGYRRRRADRLISAISQRHQAAGSRPGITTKFLVQPSSSAWRRRPSAPFGRQAQSSFAPVSPAASRSQYDGEHSDRQLVQCDHAANWLDLGLRALLR